MKKLLIILLILLSCGNAWGACSWVGNVGTAADATHKEVQACLTGAAANASGGVVTVTIPSGSVSWDTSVYLSSWTGITNMTVQGAGASSTVITNTKATDTYLNGLLAFLYVPNTVTLTVKNIGFVADGSTPTTFAYGLLLIFGDASSYANVPTEIRVTGCSFTQSSGHSGRGIRIDRAFGVIDNNTFTLTANIGFQAVTPALSISGETIPGDKSWAESVDYNSKKAVFIENNTFDFAYLGDGMMDSYDGARVHFRFNTGTGAKPTLGWHGRDSGGHRSPLMHAIYNNAATATSALTNFMGSRGGTAVVYNNVLNSNYSKFHRYMYYRSCCDCNATGCSDPAAYCSGNSFTAEQSAILVGVGYTCTYSEGHTLHGWGRCNGTNALDGNNDGSGYPCADQPGMSGSAGLTSTPDYFWNNTIDGVQVTYAGGGYYVDTSNFSCASLIGGTNNITDQIQSGRDFFDNATTPKPGYVAYKCPHILVDPTGKYNCDEAVAGAQGATPNDTGYWKLTGGGGGGTPGSGPVWTLGTGAVATFQ